MRQAAQSAAEASEKAKTALETGDAELAAGKIEQFSEAYVFHSNRIHVFICIIRGGIGMPKSCYGKQ